MCAIIIRGNRIILGYSQAVRHQTLTLAFSLVRIQLSQPRQKAPTRVPFVLAGIALMRPGLCRAQALVRIPAASRRELAHERRGEESRSEAELPGDILNGTVEMFTKLWYNIVKKGGEIDAQ